MCCGCSMAGLAVRWRPGCCSDALPLCSAAVVPALTALLLSTPQSAIMTSKDVSPLLLPAQVLQFTHITPVILNTGSSLCCRHAAAPTTDTDVRSRSSNLRLPSFALQRLM